jgi:anti-sigma regulatory factor (Ser/Thr protein kinase)
LRELSLNVMDVTQNSISAGARLIAITVAEDTEAATLAITIADDGKGMTPEQVRSVTDPFYTTRTTRDVGLGVPFFKMSSEQTGGSFKIESQPGAGTTVTACYNTAHIDMTPLGDISETVLLLIVGNPDLDFVYKRSKNGTEFTLDTRELRKVLGGEVSLGSPDVSEWIREYLAENETGINI